MIPFKLILWCYHFVGIFSLIHVVAVSFVSSYLIFYVRILSVVQSVPVKHYSEDIDRCQSFKLNIYLYKMTTDEHKWSRWCPKKWRQTWVKTSSVLKLFQWWKISYEIEKKCACACISIYVSFIHTYICVCIDMIFNERGQYSWITMNCLYFCIEKNIIKIPPKSGWFRLCCWNAGRLKTSNINRGNGFHAVLWYIRERYL